VLHTTASGVENFQNIIKNARLTKFHGDALVDKMSFATWITSHVKAVIGVATDQQVQQLAHQYLSGSALSQSNSTQRRPQADATPHERFTSWMAGWASRQLQLWRKSGESVRPSQTHPPGGYMPVTPRQRGLTTTVELTQNERADLNALRQDKSQRTCGPETRGPRQPATQNC
jgi:hypothetical protein